jgi:hypothetical protein
MDEKISLKAVDKYAQLFARQLADVFFTRKDKISGSEILTLSKVKQVNLFILRDLLATWKKESEKFKSPYFDYSAPPVNDAFTQFQNVLSNHILIAKQDFLPLLESAVSQTIYLILDPYDFYSDLLDKHAGGFIKTSELKSDVKYIKINRAPLEKLVARIEEKKLDIITGNEAFGILDQILEEVNFTPEEVEPHLQAFNEIIPVKSENFYEAKPQATSSNQSIIVEPVVKETPSAQAVNLTKENKQTLADDLAKKKIVKLKDNLTINQKFMFTKILFHGDFEIFSEAIDKLDRFDNLQQAMRFIEDGYPHWDREGEEYMEFIEIVEKRFSE